jgi:hypothetical protein
MRIWQHYLVTVGGLTIYGGQAMNRPCFSTPGKGASRS